MNASPPPLTRWQRAGSVCFNRQSTHYAALSNMAEPFPVVVDGERYGSVEHLYQASKFPDHPERHALVLAEPTPLRSKQRARRAQPGETRADWDDVKVSVMAMCLRLKAKQNATTFGTLLRSTGDRVLIEESTRDDWWGAIPVNEIELAGRNVLGLLLMELRTELSA